MRSDVLTDKTSTQSRSGLQASEVDSGVIEGRCWSDQTPRHVVPVSERGEGNEGRERLLRASRRHDTAVRVEKVSARRGGVPQHRCSNNVCWAAKRTAEGKLTHRITWDRCRSTAVASSHGCFGGPACQPKASLPARPQLAVAQQLYGDRRLFHCTAIVRAVKQHLREFRVLFEYLMVITHSWFKIAERLHIEVIHNIYIALL